MKFVNESLFFAEFYELNPSKVGAIAASCIFIFLVSPVSFLVIWYEKFGSAHNRTLINQFVTSTCWCCVAYNVLGQIPELLLIIFGPFDETFCFFHSVLKNTILTQLVVIITLISVVKYVYIFVIKNPSGKNDDFICFFTNLACALNGSIAQFVLFYMPGSNSHPYYFCSGRLPDPSVKKKMNYPITALAIVCPIVYVFVLIKIKLYRKKCNTSIIPFVAQSQSKPLPSSLGLIFQTSLANLTTVAIELLIVIPSLILMLYLGTKDLQYLIHHKNLVYFHFHGIPLILVTFSAINYFASNKKMRKTVLREIKGQLCSSSNS